MNANASNEDGPKWTALAPIERRILGALMEKARTTPNGYPMSFASLTTACNQKTNREPVSDYSVDEVEETVERMKGNGSVSIIYGSGRVVKVRQFAYDWLGVTSAEAAVMAELMLRGEQQLGELRSRASRMEPIADQGTLQKILQDLESRHLVQFLTPAGRGQMVSHNLYSERELVHVKKVAERMAAALSDEEDASENGLTSVPNQAATIATRVDSSELEMLKTKYEELQQQFTELESRVKTLEELLQ
jgi:uncharacterized protein YceH (UPF0502 family)